MTEQELTSLIADKQAKYHELAPSLTLKQSDELTDEINGLKKDLTSLLSEGAVPCLCNSEEHEVIGMLRSPVIMKHGAIHKLPIYEVGCHACGKFAQGNTSQMAVKNWNILNTNE